MSCLFDSLSYFLKIDSNTIRQIICNYLESNNQIINGIDNKILLDIEDPYYIQKMRNTNTWGGGIEIKSACNIWNIKIIVLINNRQNMIEFIPDNNNSSLNLNGIIPIEWLSNHYVPLLINEKI
jgi:hypothetical protein